MVGRCLHMEDRAQTFHMTHTCYVCETVCDVHLRAIPSLSREMLTFSRINEHNPRLQLLTQYTTHSTHPSTTFPQTHCDAWRRHADISFSPLSMHTFSQYFLTRPSYTQHIHTCTRNKVYVRAIHRLPHARPHRTANTHTHTHSYALCRTSLSLFLLRLVYRINWTCVRPSRARAPLPGNSILER